MTIEEKLEILEVLFYRSLSKYPVNNKNYQETKFFYEKYLETHEEYQEMIWYKELETGIENINKIYNSIKNKYIQLKINKNN